MKYISHILSMAVFMLATISVNNTGQNVNYVFLGVISFSLGIYCGDPNTLIFYQRRKIHKINSTEDGYWLPRFLLTTILSTLAYIIIDSIIFIPFITAVLITFLLPQGRISETYQFERVVIAGGILKLIFSLVIINYKSLSQSDLTTLFCMATFSNYIGSLYYQIKLILVDVRGVKTFNFNNFKIQFKECSSAFIYTLPIHLYTSLGGFAIVNFKGVESLPLYYIYDRLIRGLGGTVIALQSLTTSIISSLILINNFNLYRKISRYALIYSFCGLIIGLVFLVFGELVFKYISYDTSIFLNDFAWLIPISTAAMYISNLFGVQYFMVSKKFAPLILSILGAIIAFYVSLLGTSNPLAVVAIPEICIAVIQTGAFYGLYFKSKWKNKNWRS